MDSVCVCDVEEQEIELLLHLAQPPMFLKCSFFMCYVDCVCVCDVE